jgi:hypothetical protein
VFVTGMYRPALDTSLCSSGEPKREGRSSCSSRQSIAGVTVCAQAARSAGPSASRCRSRRSRHWPRNRPRKPQRRANQPPVEACATKHGRFSTQNGIAQTIWLVGTTRRLSVDNAATDFLPAAAMKYTEMTSPGHSYIFGDFTICPIEADAPGHIRAVCVTAAKNLVVQNTDGSHPAFRLLETWTAPR